MKNPKISKEGKLMVAGKRKTAVAKAVIQKGTGKITINNTNFENLQMFQKLAIQEPVEITRNVLGNFDFDINVRATGGGHNGQIEASRLAIARALVAFTKSSELKKAFTSYDRNLLIADVRRKEAYKPGDSKARRKRQKSYR